MKKPSPKLKRFVRETIKELTHALYLTEYSIDILYMDGEKPEKPETMAEIHPSHMYFEANILIYPAFFTRDVAGMREALVHEMCHIYTEPYKEMWERMASGKMVSREDEKIINERLTTLIERLVTYGFAKRLEKIKL